MEAGKSENQIPFILNPSKYKTPAKWASTVGFLGVLHIFILWIKNCKDRIIFFNFLPLIKQAVILPFYVEGGNLVTEAWEEVQARRPPSNARPCAESSQEEHKAYWVILLWMGWRHQNKLSTVQGTQQCLWLQTTLWGAWLLHCFWTHKEKLGNNIRKSDQGQIVRVIVSLLC